MSVFCEAAELSSNLKTVTKMANGVRIKVIFKTGDPKFHTLPFGLRDSEIVGWLDDIYGYDGWIDWIVL